jgi:nucleoside-diphosphate-sugar epimerase
MSSLTNPRLPKGSTILVTGVTGYIGSWVAHDALALGYKVRGAVRSLEKAEWLQTHFDNAFGEGQYSQVLLPDVSDQAAFGNAIKGAAGLAHIAVNTDLSPNPEPYIPDLVAETTGILRIAAAEPLVQAVVLTSTSMAAVPWGAKGTFEKDAYNEEYTKLAWDPSFQHPAKQFFVYAAAKAQAEKAAWKYVQEEKPQYTLNTVLPSGNFGPSLVFEKQGHPSTGGWAKELYDGELSSIAGVPPQYFIDVRDTARLHVAALVDSATSNERLWGFAEPYNWNVMLAIFRSIWPQKKFADDFKDLSLDDAIMPTESALAALEHVFGQTGWTKLETSMKDAEYDRKVIGEMKKLNV